jgi:GNAT superfamily N-acetyltransferase
VTFIVRDVSADDRAEWDKLWAGYLAFYESSLPQNVTDITFARFLDPSEPLFCLVAEDEGTHELIGMVNCVLHRGTWSIENFCYLEDLFTSAAARKRGVGRALIEAVYKRADKLGCSRVYWLTHETNYAGRSLYDQVARNLGFIQYRR